MTLEGRVKPAISLARIGAPDDVAIADLAPDLKSLVGPPSTVYTTPLLRKRTDPVRRDFDIRKTLAQGKEFGVRGPRINALHAPLPSPVFYTDHAVI